MRPQRLLNILQLLREHRYPISGDILASKLKVSLRTIYRDIKTLQEQGATIEGEAGVGYILRPGYMLPPLMFSEEEIEAIVLGMRWVAKKGDPSLNQAASSALSKVAAVLPKDAKDQLEFCSLFIGPSPTVNSDAVDLVTIRKTIQNQYKALLIYQDVNGEKSVRKIWPFALAFFDHVRIVVAWCELRQAFRHFRFDRILDFSPTTSNYPKNRQGLLKEWRQIECIPHPQF